MNDFYELFEAGKKLGKGVSELIESLSDLEPSGKVFLDCSGSKMRSGVSNWLGVSIIDGVEKDSMAMLGKPIPRKSMNQNNALVDYSQFSVFLTHPD